MSISDDSDLFWQGLKERRLLFQTCCECGRHRFPFRMSCQRCGSFEHCLTESEGSGFIYSYTVVERPLLPGFDAPYRVVLVEVDEGVRYLGLYEHEANEDPVVGLRVKAQVNPDQKVQVSFAPEAADPGGTLHSHGINQG